MIWRRRSGYAAISSAHERGKPMGLVSGTRLGRYEIERLIGVGGMGEVYSAQDTALDG